MFPLQNYKYEIPIDKALGAWSVLRKFNRHEGVDLYCEKGERVYAIEDGIVVAIENFTGSLANPPSEWWNDTIAILIEGESGVILYGELAPQKNQNWDVKIGDKIKTGDFLGKITPVLKKDKGKVPSTSMLHIELYEHGTRESVIWELDQPKPKNLLDITPLLKKEIALKKEVTIIAEGILDKLYEVTTTEEGTKKLLKWLNQNLYSKYEQETKEFIQNKTRMWGDNVDNEVEYLLSYDSVEEMDSFLYRSTNNFDTKYDCGFWINQELFKELYKEKNTPDLIEEYGEFKHDMVCLPIPLDSKYFNATLRANVYLTLDLKNIIYIGFSSH